MIPRHVRKFVYINGAKQGKVHQARFKYDELSSVIDDIP
jgi:hypothetical protein